MSTIVIKKLAVAFALVSFGILFFGSLLFESRLWTAFIRGVEGAVLFGSMILLVGSLIADKPGNQTIIKPNDNELEGDLKLDELL
jgi:hypothetical protein